MVRIAELGVCREAVPISSLSTSERLRVGISLQDALCSLTGLGFLLVDNFDMLDQKNRDLVAAGLCELGVDYETIIVLGTRDEKPDPPAKGGIVRAYWLVGGAPGELEEIVAA